VAKRYAAGADDRVIGKRRLHALPPPPSTPQGWRRGAGAGVGGGAKAGGEKLTRPPRFSKPGGLS
jgi:hypothetical protein